MPELMLVGIGRMGRPYVDAAKRLGLRVHGVEAASRVDAVAGELDAVRACRGELDELWAEAASAAKSQFLATNGTFASVCDGQPCRAATS